MVTISAGHIIPVACIACLGVQRNTVSLQHTATSLDIWRYILDRQQITRTGQHFIWQNLFVNFSLDNDSPDSTTYVWLPVSSDTLYTLLNP